MAVIYRPHTIAEYHRVMQRVQTTREQYEAITDVGEAEAFAEANWEDLKAVVEPPPVNALILAEFMDLYERQTTHLANALREFGKIPEGKEIPQNAITLWKAMIHGFDRVADFLTRRPER